MTDSDRNNRCILTLLLFIAMVGGHLVILGFFDIVPTRVEKAADVFSLSFDAVDEVEEPSIPAPAASQPELQPTVPAAAIISEEEPLPSMKREESASLSPAPQKTGTTQEAEPGLLQAAAAPTGVSTPIETGERAVETATERPDRVASGSQSEDDENRSERPSTVEYRRLVLNRLEACKIYPLAARKRELEGDVTLYFTIQPDGSIGELLLKDSTAHKFLIAAAMKSVHQAEPFPAPPGDGTTDIEMVVTIRYRLEA
ncbi:TonB family protein [Sediminispirochaeta smaragdinae DSM 11293]|uniref:TonB family protein n=2 Tax=Sediminispirochaeta TaxID=1911556 RepID=E1R6A3_SEDSS|nr:TonB family protein [Sediminispirochaeta smaragdinae DSM 11293]